MSPGQEPDIVDDGMELLPDAESSDASTSLNDGETANQLLSVEETGDGRSASLPVKYGTGSDVPETLTALNVYLAKLKDVEILPIEEQALLATEYQTTGSQDAAAKLVASNLRLVVKIAFQFKRQWADVMDLIAEGNVGLAEAIRKFDVDKGIPFPSYARYWIRARISATTFH